MKKYERERDPYGLERHRVAFELGYRYLKGDLYKLPVSWDNEYVTIDLSATGNMPHQILRSTCIQLATKVKEAYGEGYNEGANDMISSF